MICASYPPRICGVGDYTSQLAENLRWQGVKTTVWTGVNEAEPEPGIVAPLAEGWDVAGVRRLVGDLKRARPALVHLQYERSIYRDSCAVPLLLPLLLRRAGLPLVTTFHALDGPRWRGRGQRLALLPLMYHSRDIVVCSQRQFHALQRLPKLGARTTLIPVGSLIPATTPRPPTRAAGPLRLLYFGFLWRGRNVEAVLDTLKAVRETAHGAGAALDIIGGVRGADYLAELEQRAKELGIAESVRFRGALPAAEVSEAFANADLALLPFETGVSTGRTSLMAAFDHGTPVVTYGTSDNLSPLFRDGENMSITAVGDTAGFIHRAVALANDPAVRARLSAGAAVLAESFSWEAIAGKTLGLGGYREISA